MMTLERQLDESLITERMIAALSTVFGVLATVLAVMGLYGVMAYTVARRSREIGIRMALGANSGNVVWLVMREVLLLVVGGVGVGLPAALALSKLVRAQLYGVEPDDPRSIAAATLLLAAVAVLAGYLPARRASSYDPVRVLRYE
jgi:ABC-type antimicrobial peptide transport system permease subunit